MATPVSLASHFISLFEAFQEALAFKLCAAPCKLQILIKYL